jgi:hypothetical protein
MRLYSFSRADGRRVDDFGSDFVLSPLINPGGVARVTCLHLGPGELVGRHEAVQGQLFCVVDGEGWVQGSGPDASPIATWQAAYWAPGELHAAGTDSGLTALVLEGDDFEVWASPVK